MGTRIELYKELISEQVQILDELTNLRLARRQLELEVHRLQSDLAVARAALEKIAIEYVVVDDEVDMEVERVAAYARSVLTRLGIGK